MAARRGRNIGVVAAARRQLEYVEDALRDHHVRALHTRAGGMTPAALPPNRSARVVQVMTPAADIRRGRPF